MRKFIELLALSFAISFGAYAVQNPASLFNFKLLGSDSQTIKLIVIEDESAASGSFVPDAKKGLAIIRSKAIKSPAEVVLNFASNKSAGGTGPHKITAYKLHRLGSNPETVEAMLKFVDDYTAILEKRYPYRFVVKKRSCMNQKEAFFNCLYEEKQSWNTLFFVNNGQISINLFPVLEEDSREVIGGAVVIAYTLGTGKFLDTSA